MSRGAKQLAYGIFYIAVFGVFVLLFLGGFSGEEPDRVIECEGILVEDGECVKDYEEVRLGLPPFLLRADGSYASLLALLENPNLEYGVRGAEYEIQILDGSKKIIYSENGTTPIYPGEKRYIYKHFGKDIAVNGSRAQLVVKKILWANADEFLQPNLVIEDVAAVFEKGKIAVRGVVKNGSSLVVNEARALAILKDRFNVPLFAAETVIGGLRGFEEREILILFPESDELSALYDPLSTEVFIYAMPK